LRESDSSNTDADVEPTASHEQMGAEGVQRFDTPVRLSFTHYRHNLADIDNLSVKAFIDGIVAGGILVDDSAKEVKSISHEQVKITKTETERTTLEITVA